MVRYATALPRFFWWGFKRASWVERAIVVTGFLLLLGLVWPADESDAAVGKWKWADPDQYWEFEKTGWNEARKDAIRDAAATWESETDFNPRITTLEVDNDITWGQLPHPWDSSCSIPTGSTLARVCRLKTPGGGALVEVDIIFNSAKTWSPIVRLEGVAAHEFGHGGGLKHDLADECDGGDPDLNTMCPTVQWSNAGSWATLEASDISDMNSIY